jgi:hypothetical protein
MGSVPTGRHSSERNDESKHVSIASLRTKLKNPFVLVAQGFLFGVILFWTLAPRDTAAYQSDWSASTAVDQTN